MAQSITVTKDKNQYNIFTVTMVITEGELLAIVNALTKHNSPVGNDVLQMLQSNQIVSQLEKEVALSLLDILQNLSVE